MNQRELSPWQLFAESCRKSPDSLMLLHNEYQFTYGQIRDRVLEHAALLQVWDFLAGGLYLPNCPEFISFLLALNKEGKLVVPLSYQLKGESLCERINYSDIEVLITDENGFHEISSMMDRLLVKVILVLDSQGGTRGFSFERRKDSPGGIPENTFGICFTGGSTSKPKGVLLSNRAVSGNALAVAEVYGFDASDRFLMARPMTQAGPIASDLLMAVSCGASIALMNDLYHPAVFLKAIEDFRPTTTYLVRTMLAQILEYPQFSRYDTGALKRLVLGAMITPEKVFMDTLNKFPGIDLYNAYGLSEAAVRVSFAGTEDILRYPGTVGRPMRGCSMEVLRDDGTPAVPFEEGEIYVHTEYLMDGYYKYEDLTREAITERGLRTRDKGYRNEAGLFFIVGRADDLIIQGGNNVYPIEIEEVLLLHPQVKEAVVLGVEDEKLGQRIVAMVRTEPGAGVLQGEVYKWCRQNLEERKIPRDICFVEQIPRNEMGKINKKVLKELYQLRLERGSLNGEGNAARGEAACVNGVSGNRGG